MCCCPGCGHFVAPAAHVVVSLFLCLKSFCVLAKFLCVVFVAAGGTRALVMVGLSAYVVLTVCSSRFIYCRIDLLIMVSVYTESFFTGQNCRNNEEVTLIRKADLENHNKDGGFWTVIDGKVYDIKDFQTQSLTGNSILGKSMLSASWLEVAADVILSIWLLN